MNGDMSLVLVSIAVKQRDVINVVYCHNDMNSRRDVINVVNPHNDTNSQNPAACYWCMYIINDLDSYLIALVR